MTAAHSQALCDRLRRLCEVHPRKVAAEIVGVSADFVTRCARRGWKAGQPGPKRRERPGDFAIQADRMTIAELERHYRTSQANIYRWLATVDRTYAPRWPGREQKPRPDRAVVEDRIAELGVTRAAQSFGVTAVTFVRWREALGLPIDRKPKTLRAARPDPRRWTDRFTAERAAPRRPSRTPSTQKEVSHV